MFVFPQKSYFKALILSVIVFGDGVFGRYLGLDDITRVESSRWD